MPNSARRNLITPVENALPVNSQQIHNLISNTNEKDLLFYEYEIVDKDKEARWARKEARKYGLLLFSRWLFMIVGNAIIVALTCAICAILIYVNTPIGVTVKPLTYDQSCVTGSTSCDSVRFLTCVSDVCKCLGNRYWNGTDCTCTDDQYWDGLACLTKQGYQQPCSSSLPCYRNFTCDPLTSTCLCPSNSAIYYTKYYTGDVTNLYSGTCLDKNTFGGACNGYGVAACQEYNFLTCSLANGGIYTCTCYNGYYWRSDLGYCVPQGKKKDDSCIGSTPGNFGCWTNTSLLCTANKCVCPTNNYWNNNTNVCTPVGGYMSNCYDSTWCNTALGLRCYFTSMGVAAACNCPTTSINSRCDCDPTTSYWDGQKCSSRVALNNPCPFKNACISTLDCLYGYCL